MGDWIINGQRMSDEEYKVLIRREELARDQMRQEAAQLLQRLGETYSALTRMVEQNPGIGFPVCSDTEEAERSVFAKLRENLQQANQVPRCQWVKQDGTGCGSPQMRKHIYCFAHKRMAEAEALALRLPAVEDANGIQMAIMEVQRALIDDEISEKKAGLLLYSLQLAMTNARQTTFGQANDEELVMEVDEQKALSNQHLTVRQHQHQEPFTTEVTEDTEEKKPLPLMYADDADREDGLSQKNVDRADLDKPDERTAPKAERNRSRVELPVSVLKTDTLSGSFDAPSRAPHAPACSG